MMRVPWRLLGAAVLLAVLLPSRDAEAVIPSAMGPIQALLVILPQILLALAAGFVALFKPRTYKLLFAYLWSHKVLTLVLAAGVWFLGWGPSLSSGKATEERSGAPWIAFRGGAGRTGAVAGAKGFLGPPRVLWKLAGDALGSGVSVDSSPAAVGNRVYFGAAFNLGSPFGDSGAIFAADADTRAVAWQWTGKGELPTPLRPVFSSPAVACENSEKGAPPIARWLVCGEGYHEDKNGRIICLDLEPLRKGAKSPKLAWFLQATDHAEASPCIFEGRVITGCGDDGVWCLELATGKVLWHINGEPEWYQVLGGPKAAALATLAGKTVVATGIVKRVNAGAKDKDDPGQMTIDISEFREAAAPPVPLMESGRTLERAVFGKVLVQGDDVQIKVLYLNPDSESSPVGVVMGNKDQRVLFGSGIGGQLVNCVNALTGEPIWRTPTPYPAFGAPSVAGDRVLIGCGKGDFVNVSPDHAGMILCLGLADGKELWRAPIDDTILGSIAVHEGRAYAGSRDGNVYVVDLQKGEILQKLATGAPILSSPAVTAEALYVANLGGKVFAFDRKTGHPRATFSLDSEIISSPAIAGGRLFIGTRNKGIFALADRPSDEATKLADRPWMNPGGDAGRTGCADDRGLPQVQPDKDGMVEAKWPTPAELGRPVSGPLSASGSLILAPFGDSMVEVDVRTGQRVGTRRPPPAGLPTAIQAHDLVFEVEDAVLRCRTPDRIVLWSARIEPAPTGIPALAGDRIIIAAAGKEKAKGFLLAYRLVDGTPVWRQELDEPAITYPVASAEWVAVGTADDKIALFRAADGKKREPIIVGGRPVAPAMVNDVLVVAGHERIACYDLSASDWPWNYKDQDNIGDATGQPVISNETIWVGTTKRGLVAIGVPPTTAKK